MKQVVFLGNHKDFNALRLGLRLAYTLRDGGHEILLGGIKGKVPAKTGLATLTVGATASAKTIAAAFKKVRVERVISLASLPACEAAGMIEVPYIYCEPENFKEAKAVKNKKTLLKAAQRVVVLGNSSKALDKKRYGANALRVKDPALWEEHGWGDRPALFKKPNNLLAMGQLTKKSGTEALLTLWAQLAVRHPSWHLTVVGEGAAKTAFKRFITSHNLQACTELVGAEADTAALLRHADIFISPETGNTERVLDAMASRLPVVAAASKETQALITDTVDGCLVESGNAEQWMTVLDGLMVNWGLRVGIAGRAASMRQRFALEAFLSCFED